MSTLALPEAARVSGIAERSRQRNAVLFLCALWFVIFFASLFTPPVLDDADGTHANAARQMALSADYVTLRVNNVRYLEKAPLPYWIAAASIRVFGVNAFAVHFPQAVAVLLLMLLGYRWANRSYGSRAALYTGLGVLTSAGVFLFTRVFIPDILLSLLLAAALYCFLRALGEEARPSARFYPYALWTALALAVLTKGLVALVFFFGATCIYAVVTGEYRNWRALKPGTGVVLFLAVAAPWHILAGLRNTGGMNGHGFFWFYFINEHVLRFLGRRMPRDYNKLPPYLYWTLHLVWLFPWSLFAPLALFAGRYRHRTSGVPHWRVGSPDSGPSSTAGGLSARSTTLLLTIFAALVLLFFSISTNQEYYTFPVYLPLLMLIAASLARTEDLLTLRPRSRNRLLTFAHVAFTVLGLLVAAALSYGLWVSRHLAAVADVGDFVAHRGVGNYTLSMSSLFDLTGPSFAALRLPAALALIAFAFGPGIAWVLRASRRHLASTIAVGLTSALFLVAAHLAFARFATLLSSENFAAQIQDLESHRQIAPDSEVLLYGDQAYGASIPYYLDRPLSHPALLVDGRSSSMLFGSTFPDAAPLFLTPQQLVAQWGTGRRKILFVPIDHHDEIGRLLAGRQILIAEAAGKELITDRPLDLATAR